MRRKWSILLAATSLLSCGDPSDGGWKPSTRGEVSVRVHALDEASVTRVVVQFSKVSNHAVNRTHTILRQADNTFNELLKGVEVGEYDVSAEAWSGNVRAFWSIPIRFEVLPNTANLLELFLFQEEDSLVENPYITAVSFEGPPVVLEPVGIRVWGSGGVGTVTLAGSGTGTFDNAGVQGLPTDPGGARLEWIPVGPQPGEQDITLILRDDDGNEYRMTISVFANPQRGDVQFSMIFNHAPEAALVLEISHEGALAEAKLDTTYRDPDAAGWQGPEHWLEATWDFSDCAGKGWSLTSGIVSERVDVKGGPVTRSFTLEKKDVAAALTCTVTLDLSDDNPPLSPSARTLQLHLRVGDVDPVVPCPDGWTDCDGDPSNGCEADLGREPNCGGCGITCLPDQYCSDAGCACYDAGFGPCDGTCVDLQNDPEHCGTCGTSCVVGCDGGGCIPVDVALVPQKQGNNFTMAVGTDGKLYLWGKNDRGQLGNGKSGTQERELRPAPLNLPAPVISVASGASNTTVTASTCAALANGEVYCWGDNSRLQAGKAATGDPQTTPVPILLSDDSRLSGATKVASSSGAFCAVVGPNREVQCWGSNASSMLGYTGSPTTSATPWKIPHPTNAGESLRDVERISGGESFFCALVTGGEVYCWGSNGAGQFGNGTVGNTSPTPVKTTLRLPAIDLSTSYQSACAVLSDGKVDCWGRGRGLVGSSSSEVTRSTPVTISGIGGAVGVSAGFGHACAWSSNGQAYCWGINSTGQLGLGTTDSIQHTSGQSVLMAPGQPMTGIQSIQAGGSSTCALSTTGVLRCWGGNSTGQLGTGNLDSPVLSPVPPLW